MSNESTRNASHVLAAQQNILDAQNAQIDNLTAQLEGKRAEFGKVAGDAIGKGMGDLEAKADQLSAEAQRFEKKATKAANRGIGAFFGAIGSAIKSAVGRFFSAIKEKITSAFKGSSTRSSTMLNSQQQTDIAASPGPEAPQQNHQKLAGLGLGCKPVTPGPAPGKQHGQWGASTTNRRGPKGQDLGL